MTRLLLRLLGRAATVLALSVAVLTVGGLALVSQRGDRVLIVLSGSMEPRFAAGDAVLVGPVAESELRPGQVITFHAPGQREKLTTHRIIRLRPQPQGLFLQTQGDANATPDPDFVAAGAVVGVMKSSLPHVGRWLAFYQTPRGQMLVLGLPLALICLAQARSSWRDYRGRTPSDEAAALGPASVSPPVPTRGPVPTPALAPLSAAVVAGVVVLAVLAGVAVSRVTAARFSEASSVASNTLASAAIYCAVASTYAATVTADAPIIFHRFSETTGTVAANSGSGSAGTYTAAGGYTLAQPGATSCETSRAVRLNGSTGQVTNTNATATAGDNTFSAEAWFRTTTGGGKLVGFGNSRTGTSTSRDRHVYLTDAGQVVFGVNPTAGIRTVTSPASYLDGRWHHVVATLGATSPQNGMRLYVDGALVASRTDTTTGQSFSGYWRIGYDSLAGWTPLPSNFWFTGDLDEVAVFGTTLTAARVTAHYTARRN